MITKIRLLNIVLHDKEIRNLCNNYKIKIVEKDKKIKM